MAFFLERIGVTMKRRYVDLSFVNSQYLEEQRRLRIYFNDFLIINIWL